MCNPTRSLLFSFALAICGVIGCGSGDDSDTANVRLFHALPNASTINLLIDRDPVIKNLAYGIQSKTFQVDEGTHRVEVEVNGLLASVVDQNNAFSSQQSYSIYVIGPLNAASVLVQRDRKDIDIREGEFKVRLVHLSPVRGNYDVYIVKPEDSLNGAVPVVSRLSYKEVSNYFDLAQGDIEIVITETGTKNVVLDSGPLTIDQAKRYSYILIDQPEGGPPVLGTFIGDN